MRSTGRALRIMMRTFLLERVRRPGSLIFEAVLPLGLACGALLLGGPGEVGITILALSLPAGLLVSCAFDFGVLVDGGFWKRARVSPAGGVVTYVATAGVSALLWLAMSAVGVALLVARGHVPHARLLWVLVGWAGAAPAIAALGLAVLALTRGPVAAVTASPVTLGFLSLMPAIPGLLGRRFGLDPTAWAWIARLSPVELVRCTWLRAAGLRTEGAITDAALAPVFALAGLLAIAALLRLLERRES